MAEVPPEKLSLIRPINEEGVPWIGLLTGVPLIGFYFWCTNQFMVQRILAAKSIEHGRWGSLFAGLLKLPVLFVMVLPGSAALLLFPTLERADLVYPTLVFNLLPIGLVGLVTAAFLGAIMSSTASTFNSASTLITMDFVSRFRPGMSPAALVAVGRIATVIVMLLAVAWVPVVSAVSDTLWQYLQSVLAYAVTPIVALFAGGVLSARVNARGARAGILVGIVTGAALFWAGPVAEVWKLHFLVAAALIFAASLAALALASRTAPPPDPAQIGPLLWTTALWRADSVAMANRPAWQNYRLQSVLLLALTAAIVWVFR
jgi:SSS family solute:Na+ symporter